LSNWLAQLQHRRLVNCREFVGSSLVMFGVEDSFVELLRSLPIPCWLLCSIILLSAGLGPVPATAVHEFTAHRMQHFDMYGVRYGN